eukprot:jgi/Mesvir1/20518/Mv25336-RA.1
MVAVGRSTWLYSRDRKLTMSSYTVLKMALFNLNVELPCSSDSFSLFFWRSTDPADRDLLVLRAVRRCVQSFDLRLLLSFFSTDISFTKCGGARRQVIMTSGAYS